MKVQFGDTPTTSRDILNIEHSRVATDKVLGYIQSYPDKIEELMACFFDDNPRICQRAAWSVGDLGERYFCLKMSVTCAFKYRSISTVS